MAGIVVLVGLGLLTQSRSWGIGLIASSVLVLAAIPGRRRRLAAILVAGATIAVLYSPLADVWRHPGQFGVVSAARTRHAATGILLAAVAAGAVWALAVLAFERGAAEGSTARRLTARLTDVTVGALALAAVVAVGIEAGAIGHRIHTQYEAFVHLAPTPGGTRLFSGGGNRYDYWRVAVLEFRSEPLRGVGAGNYDVGYYLHRRTTESITQPHSLELQTLAELGLVGGLLLLGFLGAVAFGFFRISRAARGSPWARAVAVAGGGAFASWLVQTSVDWMHLIPGLTAIALAAGVALLAATRTESGDRESSADPGGRGCGGDRVRRRADDRPPNPVSAGPARSRACARQRLTPGRDRRREQGARLRSALGPGARPARGRLRPLARVRSRARRPRARARGRAPQLGHVGAAGRSADPPRRAAAGAHGLRARSQARPARVHPPERGRDQRAATAEVTRQRVPDYT